MLLFVVCVIVLNYCFELLKIKEKIKKKSNKKKVVKKKIYIFKKKKKYTHPPTERPRENKKEKRVKQVKS